MNQGMLNKLKKIQKEMENAQQEIQATEFEGKATGVTVVLQGSRRVVDVKIDMELLTDLECLQDSILIAMNNALEKIDNADQQVMEKYANFGLSGLGF